MNRSAAGSADDPPAWDAVAEWWGREVANDLVYREDVAPILDRLLSGAPGPMLELGCGEGQWLRHLDRRSDVFGMDGSGRLLRTAGKAAPVARGELPDLGWVRTNGLGAAFSVFVLDLIEDHERFFAEAARVVRDAGALVVLINHPVFTAPDSGPFMDEELDVFWRWGAYLGRGGTPVPAGGRMMTMYHRPVGDLLTAAAAAGWSLEAMVEAPLGPAAIAREPTYVGQEGIPRFLGVRWRRRDP